MAKVAVVQMSDSDLVTAYQKGKEFLNCKFQVSGSDKSRDGSTYDHDLWLRGCRKVEKIELQMRERELL